MAEIAPLLRKPGGALVLSIGGATNARLIERLERVPAGVDLVEVRIDQLRERPALGALRASTPLPMIATVRSPEEGGSDHFPPAARARLFVEALDRGFELIDVEGFSELASDDAILRHRACTILSFHDFDGIPNDFATRATVLADSAPAAVKVVATAHVAADCRPVFDLLRRYAHDVPLAAFCMGEPGLLSRVLAPQLGSALTYCAWESGEETAPGQLPVRDAIEAYGLGGALREKPERLFAVLAGSASRSASPLLHNRVFRKLGARALYVPISVRDLRAELPVLFRSEKEGGLFDSGIPLAGASVTVPWKEDALSLVDEASLAAKEVGAANTLLRKEDGRLAADNTDLPGLVSLLTRLGVTAEDPAAVLGSGGAARASVVALRKLGADVVLFGRGERAAKAAAELSVRHREWHAGDTVPGARILVNATPVGGRDRDDPPIPLDSLGPDRIVVDLVYRPGGTELVREAADAGSVAVDGYALLVAQAAPQASLFLGREVTEELVADSLELPSPHWRTTEIRRGAR